MFILKKSTIFLQIGLYSGNIPYSWGSHFDQVSWLKAKDCEFLTMIILKLEKYKQAIIIQLISYSKSLNIMKFLNLEKWHQRHLGLNSLAYFIDVCMSKICPKYKKKFWFDRAMLLMCSILLLRNMCKIGTGMIFRLVLDK